MKTGEIDAIVEERVEIETRERVAKAIALNAVDQIECGTQTVEFAAPTNKEEDDDLTDLNVDENEDDNGGMSYAGGRGSRLVSSHPLAPPPVLPPGFHLVHCIEKDLQVCPGVQY